MKKILSLILCAAMLLSMFVFAGCDKTDVNGGEETKNEETKAEVAETLKFGMGSHSYIEKATSATADAEGKAEAVTTVAAVLVDAEGKIVKCVIDATANAAAFTAEGKFVEAGEFKTKYELGSDYGMVAYAGAAKEWFEQADAFAATVVGKTADEVKALAAADGKGTDDVISAGCTITVSDFVVAVAVAVENAAESTATKDATLKIGMVSAQVDSKDATADAEGVNEIDTTVAAAAVDADGKVIAMATDAVQAKIKFDATGAVVTENGEIKTKGDLGTDYGMVAYAGAAKEWFEQADAFEGVCAGKTATEIAALVAENGYNGVDALVNAGCTIGVADLVKAAVKAATVA